MDRVIKRDMGIKYISNCNQCPYKKIIEELELYDNPFIRMSSTICSKFNLIINDVNIIHENCKLLTERDISINKIIGE